MKKSTIIILAITLFLASMSLTQGTKPKRVSRRPKGFAIDIVVLNVDGTDGPNGATSKEDSITNGARYETWVIDYKSGEGYAETRHWYAYHEPNFISSPSVTYVYSSDFSAGNVHFTDVENFKRWNDSDSIWERITWNGPSEAHPDTLVLKMYDVEGDFAGDSGVLKETYSGSSTDTLILDLANSVDEYQGPTDEFYLSQNTPNPFKTQTTIEYRLPEKAHVRLTVTNLRGEEVATLVDKTLPSGYNTAKWDGKFESGSKAPAGVYFYKFTANDGDYQKKMKMVLTK